MDRSTASDSSKPDGHPMVKGGDIVGFELYRPASIRLEHVPFVALYAVAFYQFYTTFGDPYRTALEKASALEPSEEDGFLPPCMPLPSPFMPSFASRLLFGVTLILHILLILGQYWSVSFRAFINYSVADLDVATHAKVIPAQHKGKAAIVEVRRTPKGAPFFEFQRQKFFFEKDSKRSDSTRAFRRVRCPVDLPLESYFEHTGLTHSQANGRQQRYGDNKFVIEMPKFIDLYIDGLLKPFSVFQFFCILLWCLDEYWQYSVFTLFMMFVFEGTVVMSRRKNLQALRGMNNQARIVYAMRQGTWIKVNANKLVPGDMISVPKGSGTDEDVVPCDCLILSGSAVVNEATLTGESVPQLKEQASRNVEHLTQSLDINGQHKVHVLWGGTKLLQHTGEKDDKALVFDPETGQNATPPEDWQTLPQPKGTPDGGCLCYVLRTGFDSSQGKLVRMIEFSSENVSGNTMEAALLVLFLLIFALSASGYVLKAGLEAERDQFDLLLHCIMIVTSVIPPELNMQMALAVNTSLMALMALHIFCTEPYRIPLAGKVDICLFDKTGTITTDELVADAVVSAESNEMDSELHQVQEVSMKETPLWPRLVLAGCHSMVTVDGKISGDPIETASLKAIAWEYNDSNCEATPIKRENAPERIDKGASVKVLHRYHFTSKLQRMSTICKVKASDADKARYMVLTKGSPEALAKLCNATAKSSSASGAGLPTWYEPVYKQMARKGMRVLALARRHLDIGNLKESELSDLPQSQIEEHLEFVGFIGFRCLVRRDSKAVLQALKESAHQITMVTGDAVLTAIHVATEVGMVDEDKGQSLLLRAKDETATSFQWVRASDDALHSDFSVDTMDSLAASFGLCCDGPTLEAARSQYPQLDSKLHLLRVLARMTPAMKESVISELNARQHHTVMCGDGANDVGALKQAHVGIALLSGFGSANADKKDESTELAKADPEKEEKRKEMEKLRKMTAFQRMKYQWSKQQKEIAEETEKLRAQGDPSAAWKAAQIVMARQKQQAREMTRARGSVTSSAAMMASQDLEDGSVPMVKLGDASIASPFTSKKPSISSTVDVIRQGRCTLVTTLQMYQIIALNCLISSYSLSVLYLDGVKYGDRQMMASGLLSTAAFMSLSYAKPLQKLSDVRPITSIFHPALFLSLLGQFAVHLGVMMMAVSMAKSALEEPWEPSIETKFSPNLINSVVFLISTVQHVTVFVVNYKGLPFMRSLTDNPVLIWSLVFSGVGSFILAGNYFPDLNKLLQLVEYPSSTFQKQFMMLLAFDVVGTLIWDRLMLLFFAPQILFASLKGFSFKDVRSLVFKVAIVYLVMSMFNIDPEELERLQEQLEQQAE